MSLALRRDNGRSGGFTITELLVVVSVITVLFGLLLTAVQAAREAARKISCQSNVRQLGLATLNFESNQKRFPSGGWGYQWQGYPDIRSSAGQPGSWTYSLLPMIEQELVYQLGAYSSSQEMRNSDISLRVGTLIPIFNCPTRRPNVAIPFADDCSSCSSPIGVTRPLLLSARCDYAMNAGDGSPDFTHIDSWPLNYWGPENPTVANDAIRNGSWPKPPQDWSGISWFARSVTHRDITDGASNTFLLGEKYLMSDAYNSGKDWGDNEPLFGGFNNDNHRSTHPYWSILKDSAGKQSIGSFGSAHASGANFAFSDGRVSQVSFSIDKKIYQFFGNRHDGRNTQVPE